MLGAIYTSLSGMNAYRTGLDVISNNVANMNTPGFKLSDPLFRDLVRQSGGAVGTGNASSESNGAGVQAGNASPSFQQGELRTTGNALDAAVDGAGFFVLELDGRRMYTRAGEFELNKDGILVERLSGAKVLVNTDAASFVYFDVTAQKVFAPKTTTKVDLSGTLARGGETTTFELPEVTVIDTGGAKVNLKVRFARDATDLLLWTMEVVDKDNQVIGSGPVRFKEDGTPADDAATLKVTVTPTGTPAFEVTFNLGAAGTYGGVTSIAGTTTSQVQLLKQDGVELGSLTKTEFTDQGEIKLTYSNGETKNVAKLLLAQFDSTDQLLSLGGSHYVTSGSREPTYSTALNDGLGRVVGGQIELSNVDLTDQFTDLIIVQRGYQASSQITSVANEMIQQLLSMTNGR